MKKNNKPQATSEALNHVTNMTKPELSSLPVNDLIYPEVKLLVDQINQTRALLSKLEEALAPIVRTAFAQANIDPNQISEVNFDSEGKAFTYLMK